MATASTASDTVKGSRKDRAIPTKQWDIKDVEYVANNYEQMTVADIAKKRSLATFQVNQIITGLRQRNMLGKKRKNTQKLILDKYVEKHASK